VAPHVLTIKKSIKSYDSASPSLNALARLGRGPGVGALARLGRGPGVGAPARLGRGPGGGGACAFGEGAGGHPHISYFAIHYCECYDETS